MIQAMKYFLLSAICFSAIFATWNDGLVHHLVCLAVAAFVILDWRN